MEALEESSLSCEMRHLGRGGCPDPVKDSHGSLNTEAPEHPQGDRPQGYLKHGKTRGGGWGCTQAKALTRAHGSALSRGFISLAFKLALLYTVSVTGTDLCFLCRQESYL